MEYYRLHVPAEKTYVAHAIPIPLYLFVAKDERYVDNAFALRNWDAVLPAAQIRSIFVPGTHETIVEPPYITSLGEALSRAIREAQETLLPQPEKDYCTG